MNFLKILIRFPKVNKFLTTMIDLGLIVLGVYLAYSLKFGTLIPRRNIEPFINLIPVLLVISFVFFNVYGLLTIGRKSYTDTFFSLALSLLMITVTSMASTFFLRGFAFPRTIFIVSYFINLTLLSCWRYFLVVMHRNLHGVKKIMIVGNEEYGKELACKINISARKWYQVSYVYSKSIKDNKQDFADYLQNVDIVIMSPNMKQRDRYIVIDLCHEFVKEISIIPSVYDIQILMSSVVQFDDVMAFTLRKMELTFEQRVVKRIADFIFAIIGIILTLPLMLIIAIAIPIDSKGKILYYQERITYKKKPFKLWKFRTMIEDAEKTTGPVFCEFHDPRITRLGKFLRKTRLDELPQLFNILIGDMSIVGPRPERQFFIDQFITEVPSYKYRFNVKAGLTGLAQVLGKYSTSFDEKLSYDLLYITEYSLLMDVKIVFQTLKVLFQGSKAEGQAYEVLKDNNVSADQIASTTFID